MPNVINEKKILDEINELIAKIEVKITVETKIYKAKGMQYDPWTVSDTPGFTDVSIQLERIRDKLKELEKSNIKKLILIKRELDEIIEWIDIKGDDSAWKNVRKYQTPDNPELLKKIEKIKNDDFIEKPLESLPSSNESLASTKKKNCKCTIS